MVHNSFKPPIPDKVKAKNRLVYKSIHRFSGDHSGEWHWNGVTHDLRVPLTEAQVPPAIVKSFGLKQKNREMVKGVAMLTGDINKFAIIAEVVPKWNAPVDTFFNGIFLLVINNSLIPKVETGVLNITLDFAIDEFKNNIRKMTINDNLFNMEKTKAFLQIMSLRYPCFAGKCIDDCENCNIKETCEYDLSPMEFSDHSDNIIFKVSNGKNVKILSSYVKFDNVNSLFNLSNIEVDEVIMPIEELNKMSYDLGTLINYGSIIEVKL